MDRALRNRGRDNAVWRAATERCRDIVNQIAGERPSLHALRAAQRTQAREKIAELHKAFDDERC